MPRSTESSNHGIPAPPDVQAWRHFGDGTAGKLVAARIQGFSSSDGDYRDVAVDSSGVVQTSGGGGGGGSVTQGTSPWVVSAASLPLPTGAAKDSTLTDSTLRVGGTVAVTGTFWQSTQPVSIASMPSTPVTGPLTDTQLRATPVPISGTVTASGPLTDTQLRASAVPVSLATVPSHDVTNAGTFAVQATLTAETTKVIGTVNQGTSPWVTNDPGLPDTLGQKTAAGSTGVVLASDQLGSQQRAYSISTVPAADGDRIEVLLHRATVRRLDLLLAQIVKNYSPPDSF